MDRLRAMATFVVVAEATGFAAGARRLGLSPSAVTREVATLEASLGARLLHRTTRSVRLTEAGARYLVDCRRILADVAAAASSAAGTHGEIDGRLGVTAPALFGRLHVAPIIEAFVGQNPRVRVEALYLDRVVNLLEEGYDVAVRIGALPDSTLRAVRVGAVRRVVCAAPAYLERAGVPATPAALANHDAIAFAPDGQAAPWSFPGMGRRGPIMPRVRLVANTADTAVAAAVAGLGVTRVLSYQVEAEVEAGRLRVVLAEAEPPPLPIHVVHQEGASPATRVRAFVDLAVRQLGHRTASL
ncbi:MAG: LysR family transcriptional regulator [Alphaproteobacteria bacterium]|nr:LysR family transcriptional regulator [Alphaproteobacteria bacterium]